MSILKTLASISDDFKVESDSGDNFVLNHKQLAKEAHASFEKHASKIKSGKLSKDDLSYYAHRLINAHNNYIMHTKASKSKVK
jgi:hypothetical protein